jgi:hypothetical protein
MLNETFTVRTIARVLIKCFISVLLVYLLTPFTTKSIQVAYADNEETAASHGYLSDINIVLGNDYSWIWSYDPIQGVIDGQFVFDPSVTEYYLAIPQGFYGRVPSVTLADQSNSASLSARFRYNNTTITGGSFSISGVYEPSSSYQASILAPTSLIIGMEPRVVVLQVGKLVPGTGSLSTGQFSDVDEYTFHITRMPFLGSTSGFHAFIDSDSTNSLPVTSSSTVSYNSSDMYDYHVIAPEGTNVIYLKVEPHSNSSDLKIYFQSPDGSNWFEGLSKEGNSIPLPFSDRFLLDFSKYPKDNKGYYNVPIRLTYEGPGSCLDSYLVVRITTFDFRPVITQQPYSPAGVYNKDAMPTLSVELASVPEEYSSQVNTSYQWCGGRKTTGQSLSPTKYLIIQGATSASFTPSPTILAGDTFYYCVVTRTYEGISYSIASNEVKVTSGFTYLSPAQFTEQPVTSTGFKHSCQVGDSIGSISITVFGTARPTSGYDPLPAAITHEGGLIYVDIYRREVSTGDTELEHVLNIPWLSSQSGGANSIYGPSSGTNYARAINNLIFPASSTVGKYEYYVVLRCELEGYETQYTYSDPITITFTMPDVLSNLEGEGSSEIPYIIKDYNDLVAIRTLVNNGLSLYGLYFALDSDITLPVDWIPIGALQPGRTSPHDGVKYGVFINPFSGTIDGRGHTLTVAPGARQLLLYPRQATVVNLKIYGSEINGPGLAEVVIDYGTDGLYSTGVPAPINLENVSLLSGSNTLRSGFIHGPGSGNNHVTIRNCTVEAGVVIGYDGTCNNIGSFAGTLNGAVYDSVSYADVYGVNQVGGLAGVKGQSMGACYFERCVFLGTVTATGNNVGGILGSGYTSGSAPNTPTVTIKNCYVAASISGANRIGGIMGSEAGVVNAWNPSSIVDNFFYGTVTATATDGIAGGISGYHNSINKYQTITNNYYLDTGASSAFGGIGVVRFLDDHQYGDKFGRDDNWDPEVACQAASAAAFADGTVLAALNSSPTSFKNWVQGSAGYPVFSSESILIGLEVSGEYKTEYYIGDSLDLSGIELTGIYSDGTTVPIALGDVTITGFDNTTRGSQEVTLTYGPVSASVLVRVLLPVSGEPITVIVSIEKFTVNGSYIVEPTILTLPENATSADALDALLRLSFPGVAYPYRNTGSLAENFYLSYVWDPTFTGEAAYEGYLGEFDCGLESGWMITVNNTFIGESSSNVFLQDDSVVRWQYTCAYGHDIGTDTETLGPNTTANKDALTTRVALIRSLSEQAKYGEAYNHAMLVLMKVDSTQTEVDTALAALNLSKTGTPRSGDLNGDGIVDMSEALAIAQVVVGGGRSLSPEQLAAVDMDDDGMLTMADVVLMMRRAAGL